MQITIQGLTFNVPERYQAGHALTDNEAGAFNQLFAENLRNNFAGKAKDAKEAAEKNGTQIDMTVLQGEFDKYAAEYQFGARKVGGLRISDPIERRAFKLAKESLASQAKKMDRELTAEQLNALVPSFLDKYPNFREEARRQIENEKAIAQTEVGAADFDALMQAAAAQQAAGGGETDEGEEEQQEEEQPQEERRGRRRG